MYFVTMVGWMLATAPSGAAEPDAPTQIAEPELGRQVYGRYCSTCHGSAGDGRGPAAIALNPKPRDFTAPAWWAGRTDAEIRRVLAEGVPGTAMAAFAYLAEDEAAAVTAYLRTFAPAEAPDTTPEEQAPPPPGDEEETR